MSPEFVQIDIESIRFFISRLQAFNKELEGDWIKLANQWEASSDSWRDIKRQEQMAGTATWDESRTYMEKYLQSSEEYLNFLKRLEEKLNSYLSER